MGKCLRWLIVVRSLWLVVILIITVSITGGCIRCKVIWTRIGYTALAIEVQLLEQRPLLFYLLIQCYLVRLNFLSLLFHICSWLNCCDSKIRILDFMSSWNRLLFFFKVNSLSFLDAITHVYIHPTSLELVFVPTCDQEHWYLSYINAFDSLINELFLENLKDQHFENQSSDIIFRHMLQSAAVTFNNIRACDKGFLAIHLFASQTLNNLLRSQLKLSTFNIPNHLQYYFCLPCHIFLYHFQILLAVVTHFIAVSFIKVFS